VCGLLYQQQMSRSTKPKLTSALPAVKHSVINLKSSHVQFKR